VKLFFVILRTKYRATVPLAATACLENLSAKSTRAEDARARQRLSQLHPHCIQK
jgi:hypothetical protein